MKMNICIISNYCGKLDEGIGNVAYHLANGLSHHHKVVHLHLKNHRDIFSKVFWKRVNDLQPQIIHYVRGPSIQSLMLVKTLKFYCKEAKTVMSTTQPKFSTFSKIFIPLLKPDLVLTQSYETERMFANFGCQTKFLPNGVDTRKFIPVSIGIKHELRGKYQLPEEKFIILHVGPIKGGRNIQIFNELNRDEDNQVLIIGSTTTPMERDAFLSLKNGGCLVWRNYFENIEEFYALSDCYVFPTKDKLNCIEMPLSVMEAMSCNLPVISTRYGVLASVFSEGEGLIYAEKDEDFTYLLNKIKNNTKEVKTREKVLPYSWENIANNLEEIYKEVAL